MTKMMSRAVRATILDRRAHTEAFFDDDAMADGAVLVALVAGIIYLGLLLQVGLGAFNLFELVRVVIGEVASWLILGFATWFAATRLFGSTNRPQTLLAMHGLAVLPLILSIFGGLFAVIALIWYLVALVVATQEGTGLELRNAAVSVLIGFAAAVVIRALIGAPFIALSALF